MVSVCLSVHNQPFITQFGIGLLNPFGIGLFASWLESSVGNRAVCLRLEGS